MTEPHHNSRLPIVVAMTGASGAAYGCRLVEVLITAGVEVFLSISPAASQVARHELGRDIDLENFSLEQVLPAQPKSKKLSAEQLALVRYCHYKDLLAPIASGSHRTAGMVVCPCSGGTLSGIAHGASGNLIERAAEVHLKERRPLILVPRETPLSLVFLDNLRAAASAGAVILPAMPAWYHGAASIDDLIDFIVARILDQLGVPHHLMRRWGD